MGGGLIVHEAKGGPMQRTACPEAAELAEFAAGDLPRTTFARIADHVESCAACTTALAAFDAWTDSFVERLRQSTESGTHPLPLPPDLLALARRARDSCEDAEAPE